MASMSLAPFSRYVFESLASKLPLSNKPSHGSVIVVSTGTPIQASYDRPSWPSLVAPSTAGQRRLTVVLYGIDGRAENRWRRR